LHKPAYREAPVLQVDLRVDDVVVVVGKSIEWGDFAVGKCLG
jgi:hypothetical protein